MMKLSVCMIVKDEEKSLVRALDSVKGLADEIVVVDTGSIDRTKEIARGYTEKVYDFTWINDFSAARNFSLSKATGDWILVLDADEVIAREDHAALKSLLEKEGSIGFAFPQISYTNDSSQYGYTPLLPNDETHQRYHRYAQSYTGFIGCNIIRLFRNGLGIRFDGAVHESVDASCQKVGKILKITIWLHHYQFEQGDAFVKHKQLQYLRIYEQHLDEYPNKARAYRDIASIYYTHLQDYEKALDFFQRSLALQERNKKTYLGLGLCYLKLQHFREARDVFQHGLQIFPADAQLCYLIQYTTHLIERFIKD